MNVTKVPANTWNYGKGRAGYRPEFLVIHGMAGYLPGTDATFKGFNPLKRASTHFGIGDSGGRQETHQYVSLDDTAYGIMQSRANIPRINERSIQIEIENLDKDHNIYVPDRFLGACADLGAELAESVFGKRPDRSWIKGHAEIDPAKRECPAGISVDFLVSEMQGRWDAAHPVVRHADVPENNAAPGTTASAVIVPVRTVLTLNGPLGYVRVRTRQDTKAPYSVQPNGKTYLLDTVVSGDPVEVTYGDGTRRTSSDWYRTTDFEFFSVLLATH